MIFELYDIGSNNETILEDSVKPFFINFFESAITNNTQNIIMLHPHCGGRTGDGRGIGKSTIIGEVSTLAQIVYQKDVIMCTIHPNPQYIASEVINFNNHISKIDEQLKCRENIVIAVDELDDPNYSDKFGILFNYCQSRNIPMFGFVNKR